MDRDRLAARLLATFTEELEEQLHVLETDVLALERDPGDAERVRSVFRIVHTLKGASRAAGVLQVEALCHALESELAPARERGLRPTTLAALFTALDTLRTALDQLGGGRSAPTPTTAALAIPAPAPPPAPVVPAPVVPAPVVPAPAAPAPDAARTVAADSVRVDPARLDALHGFVGQLAGTGDRLVERTAAAEALADALARATRDLPDGHALARRAAQLARALGEDARRLESVGGRLGGAVRAMRLRPVHDVTEGLPRAVRDVAAALGKEVDLVLDGGGVEGDRAVLAALREPLLHLVRNAVDHGIEPPAVRERAGKPRRGTVRVTASAAGERLRLEVEDDGGGVDEGAVRAALTRRGVAAPADAAAVGDALFDAGLSTRQEVTAVSGRGVGLDVVRTAVTRIGGTVDVTWTAGRGTRFVIEAPVTLAVLRALVVRVGDQRLAIPTSAVVRAVRLRLAELRSLNGKPVLPGEEGGRGSGDNHPSFPRRRESSAVNSMSDGRMELDSRLRGNDGGFASLSPIPIASLAGLLGPPLTERPLEELMPVVIVGIGARRLAVVVDELLEERELVVRPIERGGHATRRYAGAAVMGGDAVLLVVNVAALLAAGVGARAPVHAAAAPRPARVLVADDSITTRALEESVLVGAGYDVVTAVDGADAWRVVSEGGIDLVVSDVEMPRMDGFALCEAIRASTRFRALPVVLVTSLDRPEHRARGLEVGADAYITKSSFDQDALLDAVRQLAGAARPGVAR